MFYKNLQEPQNNFKFFSTPFNHFRINSQERKSFPKTESRKLSDIEDIEDDDPLVEAEDEGTNFIPSKVAPTQVLPNYNPHLRYGLPSSVSDSTFGVSVTPISIDKVVWF